MSRTTNHSSANNGPSNDARKNGTTTNKPSTKPSSSGARSLRERMSHDLQFCGKAERTHDGYLRDVRKLAAYYHQAPDTLTEQQVGDYLLGERQIHLSPLHRPAQQE